MSKVLFITGTDTDIGKTYVSGLIVKKLKESGENAAYYKAAMSGNEAGDDGKLIPGDAVFVKNMSGIEQPIDEMCPYVFETAVSPHLASKIENDTISMDRIIKGFEKVSEKYDVITVEGSGGIVCPIRSDEEDTIMLEDIVKALRADCLIIADAGLGTINHVVLTYEYLKSKGIKTAGIIFNNYEKGNFLHEDNMKMCEKLTGVNVICCVEKESTDLGIGADILLPLYREIGGK